MFNNLNELIQEIENGKETRTIVSERLTYLKSMEYQKKLYKGDNRSSCEFIQGFISDDTKFGFGWIDSTCYWVDEESIYSEIIDNLIKKNIPAIKKINALPMGYLINGIRHYFSESKPDPDCLEIYNQMRSEGMDADSIREDFGERYKKHLIEKKQNEEQQELKSEIEKNEDKGAIVPIPISAIKGLNIGQCTEMSLLSQNVLSFLGYNTFLIKGEANDSKGNREAHNFNAMEKDGKYVIFDSAMLFCGLAPQIRTPEDLLIFDTMTLQNKEKSITYFSNRRSISYENPQDKMKILSEKGEQYRNDVISDLKAIRLSKKLMEKEGDTRDE